MGWPTSGYLWREGAKPAQASRRLRGAAVLHQCCPGGHHAALQCAAQARTALLALRSLCAPYLTHLAAHLGPHLAWLQEQYAGIAKAISQFEPLKMIASPGAVSGGTST